MYDWEVIGKPETNVTISVWTEAIDLDKAIYANDIATYTDTISIEVELRP